MKKGIALALALILLLSMIGCSEPGDLGEESIVYSMKINPEFEISATADLKVIGVIAKNADAEAVLASVDVVGLSVNEAFNTLAEEAKAQGFLTNEKGNTVNITILEKDDEKLPTCHLCKGCGTVECLECHGTGIFGTCGLCQGACEFHCDECGDTCWIECPECHGAAGASQRDDEEVKPDPGCWNCHGSGVCSYCKGKGYDIVTNGHDGSIKYKEDGTPETSTCTSCKGSGICSNCIGRPEYVEQQKAAKHANHECWLCNKDGHGEKPGCIPCPHTEDPDFLFGKCPECGGAGIMYCNDSFNGYNWCPCCWGSGVEGTGDPNYRDYYPDPAD